ncbi:unnamed protein product [Timema podura]|uniref:Uncharacterized protein n=1 Tax=Timema podura TaxID=61482 RepID=A0ABN7PMW5_TIMPD|nr:unnamed protein product [Timema podura]
MTVQSIARLTPWTVGPLKQPLTESGYSRDVNNMAPRKGCI